MNCNEYLPLLSGHLDGANSEAAESRLQKHLASCKQCRKLLTQLEQTDAMLLSSKTEPPADLAARIMTQVRNEPKRKKSLHRTVRSVCTAGLAAAALLALVFFGDLKLPSLKQESSADAAYSDAGNGQSASDDWTEEADFLFQNGEDTAAQAENYSITRYAGADAPTSVASTTEKGTSLTATESAESLLTLPSLSYDASGELLNDSESAEDAGTTHRLPYGFTTSEAASPLLVIWGAQAEEFSFLYGLSPSEESIPTSSDETDSLYTRLLSALSPQQASALTITEYLVSYAQFSTIFNDCVGIYETAVYYPAELYDLESCTVLVISDAQPTE
ncbi:MAG: anti-sigma factor family protein [Faecousia sp.]